MNEPADRLSRRMNPFLRAIQFGLVRMRLVVGSLCILIVLLASGLFSVNTLQRIGSDLGFFFDVNYLLARHLEDLRGATDRMNTAFILRLAGDEEEAQSLFQRHHDRLAESSMALGDLNPRLPEPLADKVGQLLPLVTHVRDHAEEFFSFDPEEGDRPLIDNFALHLAPLLLGVVESVAEIRSLNNEELARRREATQSAATLGIRVVMFIMLVATVSYLYFNYFMSLRVFQPLRRLSKAISRLAEGNLVAPIPVFGPGEFGGLTRSLNGLSERIANYQNSLQHRLDRVNQTLESTIAALPHPVFVLDPHGGIRFLNPAGQEFLASLGQEDASRLPAAVAERVGSAREADEDSHPESLACALAFEIDHSERFYFPRILLLKDPSGSLFGFTVLLEDVTKLQLIDEMKSGLIDMVSHELKTPLTGVRMALHLLHDKSAYSNDEDAELLETALEDVETLLQTLNNLLDLNRIDESGIRLIHKAWNIRRGLEDLVAKDFPEGNGLTPIRLEFQDDLPEIEIDPERLRHVFLNLISNARKFSPPDQPIIVRAEPLPDHWVRISVVDRGPGIPAAYQERIFEPFYRVPNQDKGGAGLGLSIASKIARLHGGKIHFSSMETTGTAFHVDLPVHPAESED